MKKTDDAREGIDTKPSSFQKRVRLLSNHDPADVVMLSTTKELSMAPKHPIHFDSFKTKETIKICSQFNRKTVCVYTAK